MKDVLSIEIPGLGTLVLRHLVLDYNGTLAVDGELIDGVAQRLARLSHALAIHVVTADTFGKARGALGGIACRLEILGPQRQSEAKRAYVEQLGAAACACIGNGYNDHLMLEAAALGIAVIQREGASVRTLATADVVTTAILDALDLLLEPGRLVATLRR